MGLEDGREPNPVKPTSTGGSSSPPKAAQKPAAAPADGHSGEEPDGSKAHAENVAWWRPARAKVAAAAAAVITTALALTVSNLATGWVTHLFVTSKPVAEPTSTVATPFLRQQSNHGLGWSVSPTVLTNSYLTVTASMQPGDLCDGATGWVFQQSPRQLRPPALGTNDIQWAVRNHGIPESGNYITVTVQGLHGHTVIIEQFGVRVISRRPPPTGTAAILSGGCGGLQPAFFDLNLDEYQPQVIPVAGTNSVGQHFKPVPLPHVVSESDPEQWRLQVVTKECDCSFVPYFTWSSDGSQGTFYITNGSGPWRVAAVTKAKLADEFPG